MPDREAGYINVMLWLSFYTHKNQKIKGMFPTPMAIQPLRTTVGTEVHSG